MKVHRDEYQNEDWYCPCCEIMVPQDEVTDEETHRLCGCPLEELEKFT